MEFIKNNKYKIGFIMLLITAFFLNFWGAWNEGWSNGYYSAGVKSMTTSWHNFFFNSFDPGGFITIDKPALGLWFQCISVLIFGFKGWALILPQALASVVSVGLLYKMVKKPFGEGTGLLAGLFLATTPIFTAVSRTNNLDGTLVMFMMLGAYFIIKALDENKLKYLLLSVTMIGLGFNVKMVQAFMILPAIYLVYFIFAKLDMKKRIINLSIATGLLIVVSLSWVVVVDLTPKDQRPYMGSSPSNSAINLAIGYNGVMRAMPGGGMPTGMSEAGSGSNGAPSGMPGMPMLSTGDAGITRLIGKELGTQIGFVIPLALVGLIGAVIGTRKKSLTATEEKRRAVLFWGSLFGVMFLYFSFGGIAHGYYTATAAPSIAAMAAIGISEMYLLFKGTDNTKWLLPASIAITGIIEFTMVNRHADWNSYLPWFVLIISVSGAGALALSKATTIFKEGFVIKTVLPIAVAALIVSPMVWSLTPIMYGSNSMIPSAGPELGKGEKMDIMYENPKLEKFLLNNYNNEKYLVAVPTATSASMLIINTGKPVMAVGGFAGMDKALTLDSLEKMVKNKEIRYFMVSEMDMLALMGGGSGEMEAPAMPKGIMGSLMGGGIADMMNGNKEITDWVKAHGKEVPETQWRDKNQSLDAGNIMDMMKNGMKLYDLKAAK